VRESLSKYFPNRWIARDVSILWSFLSPNITPMGFLLLGYVKDQVFRSKVGNTVELRERTKNTFVHVANQKLENRRREI
jgi:hypothetical protein